MDENRTLLDAAKEHLPKVEALSLPEDVDALALAIPEGAKVEFEALEGYRAHPNRIRAEVTHETPKSFAAYVSDFTEEGRTRVLASLKERKVVAHMDFHRPGRGQDAPSWAQHQAIWPAEFDPAFNAWFSVHGKTMGQRDFAEFLEDRCADAVTPDPADLMEVAMNFEAVRNVNFKAAVNLSTGERQFKYEETDSQTKGGVTCPKQIKLFTPVFFGCDPTEWTARLAYNIGDGGKLTFTVKIARLEELLNREFERLVDAIAVDLPGIPVHRGKALPHVHRF